MLQEETLSEKFIKRGFWLYLFTFLSAPLGYIIKMILARDLSMNDYGLFLSIISLLTLLSAINDIAWTENLNYFLPKYIIEKNYWKVKYLLKFVLKLQIFVSFFMIFIIFFLSDFLATHHFNDPKASELLKIFSLFFLGTNLLHICTALFSATQNTKLQKSSEFIRIFSSLIFTLLLFVLDRGSLFYYSWAWIAGLFVAILFAGYFFYKNYFIPYLKNTPTTYDKDLKKNFIKYAVPVFLTANISLLLSQIDSQLITNMLGNSAHAIYGNYLTIFAIPFLLLITPFISFLFPVFTELNTRKNTEKMQFIYKNTSSILIILSIWISIFFFQNGENIAEILFGSQYRESGYILKFSAPFVIFNLLNSLNFCLFAGTGQIWARTLTFAVGLPFNIILNIILIQKMGVAGSALAVGLSWIPMYIITTFFARNFFSFPKFFPIILNISTAVFAFLAIMFLEKIIWNISIFIHFAMTVSIYGIIFLATNFITFKNTITLIKNNK